MIGAMVRSTAQVHVVDRLVTGGRPASSVIAAARGEPSARLGLDAGSGVVVALSPERIVWWRGWSSGTAVAS